MWWEAIRTDTIPAAIARLAEPPRRALAVALAEAVLAAAANGGDGVDHPATVELLAAVSAHAGEALIAGDCVEDGCDHPGDDACPITVVACRACSVISGGWAGEWEGRYGVEATVETPCSLLTTMAAHYRIGSALFEHAQLADALAVAAPTRGWVVTGRRILFLLLAVVAAAAAVLSFAALRDLALVCGFAAELAWLLPVVVDAGAAAGSLVWLGGAVSTTARRFARALALGLLTLSVAANALGHGLEAFRLAPAWWVVVIVSAIAPAVLGRRRAPRGARRPHRPARRRGADRLQPHARGVRGRPAHRGRPVPSLGRRPARRARREPRPGARPGGGADRRRCRPPPAVARAGHHRVRGPPPPRARPPHHPIAHSARRAASLNGVPS